MKAILVIDMPKVDSYAEIIVKNNNNHKTLKRYAHKDLKPMPQKLGDEMQYGLYTLGFNDCIDEILGAEE